MYLFFEHIQKSNVYLKSYLNFFEQIFQFQSFNNNTPSKVRICSTRTLGISEIFFKICNTYNKIKVFLNNLNFIIVHQQSGYSILYYKLAES